MVEHNDEDEERKEIVYVEGLGWWNKFNRSISAESLKSQEIGTLAINILSGVSLFNSYFSVWVWFKFLKGTYSDGVDNFWRTWFGAMFVNGFLWIPFTIAWPALPYATATTLLLYSSWA